MDGERHSLFAAGQREGKVSRGGWAGEVRITEPRAVASGTKRRLVLVEFFNPLTSVRGSGEKRRPGGRLFHEGELSFESALQVSIDPTPSLLGNKVVREIAVDPRWFSAHERLRESRLAGGVDRGCLQQWMARHCLCLYHVSFFIHDDLNRDRS